jgi:hypothetical protein
MRLLHRYITSRTISSTTRELIVSDKKRYVVYINKKWKECTYVNGDINIRFSDIHTSFTNFIYRRSPIRTGVNFVTDKTNISLELTFEYDKPELQSGGHCVSVSLDNLFKLTIVKLTGKRISDHRLAGILVLRIMLGQISNVLKIIKKYQL